MKRTATVLMSICGAISLAFATEVPAPKAANPSAADQQASPRVLPEGWQGRLEEGLKLPDGWQFKPEARRKGSNTVLRVPGLDPTCYYIRMLRPVPADPDVPKSGFIPLQARVARNVSEPVCVPAGGLIRAATQPATPTTPR